MPHVYRYIVDTDSMNLSSITLASEEARHISRIVRLKEGDTIVVFDGCGTEAVCRIQRLTKTEAVVRPEHVQAHKRPEVRLTLVQAWLNQASVIDELIRHATEIGVTNFVFFRGDRSERSPKTSERWRRISVEACRQCGRLWLPEFQSATDLSHALDTVSGDILIATRDRPPLPIGRAIGSNEISLVVGPEGDLSEDEIASALSRGAITISLGPMTYRSEMAALLAAAFVMYEKGQLGPL